MLGVVATQQKKRRNKIKYNIHGFNQIEAIKMGLSLDDLAVLRWFIDYQSTNTMERNYIEEANDMGFWVDYSTLIDGLPILLSDSSKYLERFVELEILIQDGKIEEYKMKKKKYHETNRKKIQRILNGPLSQILKKDNLKLGYEKGTKIFIYLDRENYSKLLLNTNMETYLAENGIGVKLNNDVDIVDNVDSISSEISVGDKSVPCVGDKSVPCVGDKSVPCVGDKSVPSDSSINNPSINDSSINESSINNSSIKSEDEDRIDLSYFYKLSYDNKSFYLMDKFDVTYREMVNILQVVDMGVNEGTINSKIGSKGYWKYIYKTCKSIHEKRLTVNDNDKS